MFLIKKYKKIYKKVMDYKCKGNTITDFIRKVCQKKYAVSYPVRGNRHRCKYSNVSMTVTTFYFQILSCWMIYMYMSKCAKIFVLQNGSKTIVLHILV